MTIGKKLYVNFGIILTMVLILFLVNWFGGAAGALREGGGAGLFAAAGYHQYGAFPDDAEPSLSEQLPAERRHARS